MLCRKESGGFVQERTHAWLRHVPLWKEREGPKRELGETIDATGRIFAIFLHFGCVVSGCVMYFGKFLLSHYSVNVLKLTFERNVLSLKFH